MTSTPAHGTAIGRGLKPVLAAAAAFGLAAFTNSRSVPAEEGSRLIVLAQAATAAPAAPVDTSMFSDAQKRAIEAIVKDFLIKNPDVMIEVSKELEKRQVALQAEQQKKEIIGQKQAIFRSSNDFVLGNPKGDITVVEYFDYNCGWCKRAVDEMTKLTKADPRVRVVFKELPIFGENSTAAAKAAMASLKQGKYWEFHVALMKERQVTKDNVLKIAEKVGLDVARLKVDMVDPKLDQVLKETADIAQKLGIEGTPGFVIDSRVNVGFVPADGIKDIIADIRKTGCQIC
jgi:protein-disulfide isomerase